MNLNNNNLIIRNNIIIIKKGKKKNLRKVRKMIHIKVQKKKKVVMMDLLWLREDIRIKRLKVNKRKSQEEILKVENHKEEDFLHIKSVKAVKNIKKEVIRKTVFIMKRQRNM